MSKRIQKKGVVYLIGAGPGDPALLTLKGKELLKQADVVFYDYLIHPEILNYCPQAELQYVGKVGHGDSFSQEKIHQALIKAAKKYSTIVRLKGGDPFLFGRGGEEALALAEAGIKFEIIPGVSSAYAVPAYAGIPVTHRDINSSVTVITGHEGACKKEDSLDDKLDWESLAREKTLVFLMGVKNLQQNFEKLIGHGMAHTTPAALIQWGSYAQQKTVVGTLSSLPVQVQEAEIRPPAIIVVGEVVQFRNKLNWFESKPLFGKRVLVTRSRHQASELSGQLRELGAEAMEFPTIQIQASNNSKPLDQAIRQIEKYDWIFFTSVNGVEFFFSRLKELQGDIRSLHRAKLAAVGPATAQQLEALRLKVDKQPQEFTTDALAATFLDTEIKDKNILLPRAAEAREEIVLDLKRRGAQIQVVESYQAIAPPYTSEELDRFFGEQKPDLLTFASSSTVKNFAKILKGRSLEKIKRIPAVVIGPVTQESAEKLGFNVVGMADPFTIKGLVGAIEAYFTK